MEQKIIIPSKKVPFWCSMANARHVFGPTWISPKFLHWNHFSQKKGWPVLYFTLVFNFSCLLHSMMMSWLHLWGNAMFTNLAWSLNYEFSSFCITPGLSKKCSMSSNTTNLLLSTIVWVESKNLCWGGDVNHEINSQIYIPDWSCKCAFSIYLP